MFTITIYPIAILLAVMIIVVLFGFGAIVGFRAGIKRAENQFVERFIPDEK